MKCMKKPNFSHGGRAHNAKAMSKSRHFNEEGVHPESSEDVSDLGEHVRDENWNSAKREARHTLGKLQMMKKPNLKGLAHGGEVENPDHADEAQDKELIHDEMKHMMGEELMSALDEKDPKRVLETIEAMILHCMNKEE